MRRPQKAIAVAWLCAAVGLSGCSSVAPSPSATVAPTLVPPTATATPTPAATVTSTPPPTATPEPDTLRSFAQAGGFLIGAAMSMDPLQGPDVNRYLETLGREFNLVTPEHVMKFEPIHPTREDYDFTHADFIVDFAERNQMAVQGHALVWHQALPLWLEDVECNRDEFTQILRDHIQTVVGHYRGRVLAWDVVNEAIGDGGGHRNTVWERCIGPDYIEMSFQWAHEADPDALLFYNDYGGEVLGARSNAIYALVSDLVDRGVPIDGVGMQMHKDIGSYPAPQDVAANMQRYADLGLQVHISEMDMAIVTPVTEEEIALQAEVYGQMLEVCLTSPNCTAFVMWGFTDAHSWIPVYFPGYDSALILDEEYNPKPAYDALMEVLSSSP